MLHGATACLHGLGEGHVHADEVSNTLLDFGDYRVAVPVEPRVAVARCIRELRRMAYVAWRSMQRLQGVHFMKARRVMLQRRRSGRAFTTKCARRLRMIVRSGPQPARAEPRRAANVTNQ